MDKKLAKNSLTKFLENEIDIILIPFGFKRSKKGTVYRRGNDVIQEIRFNIKQLKNSGIYTGLVSQVFVDINSEKIGQIALNMTKGNIELLNDDKNVFYWLPLHFFNSKDRKKLDFEFNSEYEIVQEDKKDLIELIVNKAIPFLNKYNDNTSLSNIDLDREYNFLSFFQGGVIKLISAKVLANKNDEALLLLNKYFGNSRDREVYKVVFDYFKIYNV